MIEIILLSFLSVVSFFWLGPWLMVLTGGKLFLAMAGTLAILIGWLGVWWYLIPLCLGYLDATLAAGWIAKRGRLGW